MRRLVIHCGAAETRAAYLIDDEPLYFWLGPARGDEHLLQAPEAGDIVAGRIKSVSKALNGAFADVGAARDGFLPLKNGEKAPIEGAAIIASVRRPSIGAKGAVLTLDWRKGLDAAAIASIEAQAKPGLIGLVGDVLDAALSALRQCARVADGFDIVVNDPAAKSVLERRNIGARIENDSDAAFDLDDAVAQSLEQTISLPQGAELHFHETQAGALIDVDSASAAGGATGLLNDKINLAAASFLTREISRRSIGGRVIIDFLPASGAGARATLIDAMKNGLGAMPRARFGKIAPDGLCDLTLPRERRSLLDAATEPSGSGWPVDGRRFTLDWSAKAAVRALEKELRARPSARPRLLVGRDIAAYLSDDRPQWAARLANKFGARFAIEAGASMEPRDHEVV